MVHGEKGLQVAKKASAVLFGESMEGLCADDLLGVFANVDSVEMTFDKVQGVSVIDVAAGSGLCKSKGEARRLAAQGGLYVNNRRVENAETTVNVSDIVDGRVLVLRSGKKRFHLVRVVK
jgi:tyrosyl-tRNA synthetase